MLIFETRFRAQETSLETVSLNAIRNAFTSMQDQSKVGDAVTSFNQAAAEYKKMVSNGEFAKLGDRAQIQVVSHLFYAYSSLKLQNQESQLTAVEISQGDKKAALSSVLDAFKDFFVFCTDNACYKISAGLSNVFTKELGTSQITPEWYNSLKAKADAGQEAARKVLRRLDALSILEVRIGSGKYGTATEAIAETNKRLAAEGCAPLMPESEKAVNEAHAARHQMAEMLKRQHGLVEAELKSGAGTKGRPMEFEGIITVAKQGIEKLNSSANVFLAGLEMKNGRGQALASNALAFQSAAMFSALTLPGMLRAQETQRMLYAKKSDEKSETPGQKTMNYLAAKANSPAEAVVSEATALALMGMAAYYAQELIVSNYVPPVIVDYDSKGQPPKFGGVFIPSQSALMAKAKVGAPVEFVRQQSFAPELAVTSAAFGNDRMLRNAVPPERKKAMAKFNAPAAVVSEQFSNYLATGAMNYGEVASSLSSINRISAETGIPAFNSGQTAPFYSAMRDAVSSYMDGNGGAGKFIRDGSVDHEKLVELANTADFTQKIGAYLLASAGFEPMKTVRIGKKA